VSIGSSNVALPWTSATDTLFGSATASSPPGASARTISRSAARTSAM